MIVNSANTLALAGAELEKNDSMNQYKILIVVILLQGGSLKLCVLIRVGLLV